MKQAAESGIPEAEAQLGFMYTAGKGTPADSNLAEYWHRRAAMNGSAWAQFRLAYSIIRAEDVTRERLVEAAKWLIRSFSQPEEPGERRHEMIQGDWDWLSKILTAADLDEAQQQATAEPR